MNAKSKKWLAFLGVLFFVALWIFILRLFTPTEIISRMGVNNIYIILFLIASIGGVSSFTASSYYVAIPILVAGGLDPLILAFIGGTGITIGDSLFFYLGKKGRSISSTEFYNKTEKFVNWINRSPKGVVPLGVYFFTGFTPLPNDLLTIPLGYSGYPYKKIILPLWLGNITATLLLALVSIYGINWLF
ncbi:MAG: VTT domain-containing protein [Candidatus Pacearchaeota archaeon]